MIINTNLLRIASFNPSLIPSESAWIGHIPFAAWIMQEVQPKVFVELGSHFGHSYFSFCQAAKDYNLPTQCYAIDTWDGDEQAGFYDQSIFDFFKTYNNQHYSDFSQMLRMRFNEAVSHFSDGSIELLHIDGLHTYEAVRQDFETWLPKLAPDAVVLFHDTQVKERDFGVWKFWDALKNKYPSHIEFPHAYGLGVMQLNHTNKTKQLSCLNTTPEHKKQLTEYFCTLGERQLDRYRLNNEMNVLKKEIDQITNSSFWRLTMPLRSILNTLQNNLPTKKMTASRAVNSPTEQTKR